MAGTGVLPFVRGIDFTRNDFEVSFVQTFYFDSIDLDLKVSKTEGLYIKNNFTKIQLLLDRRLFYVVAQQIIPINNTLLQQL